MLHSKSLTAALIIFSLFIVSGCDNNNTVSVGDTTNQHLLSKIIQDTNDYSTFSYENGKLIKYESISGSNVMETINLNYGSNDRPQTEDYSSDISGNLLKQYYYGSPSKIDSVNVLYAGTNSLAWHLIYLYNSSNQLEEIENYNSAYKLAYTTQYKYDAAGNVIEKNLFDSKGLIQTVTMTYDNGINPWYNLKNQFNYDLTFSKNNALTISNVFSDSLQNNIDIINNYTYDSYGYPKSVKIEITSNNVKSTINRTYEYQ